MRPSPLGNCVNADLPSHVLQFTFKHPFPAECTRCGEHLTVVPILSSGFRSCTERCAALCSSTVSDRTAEAIAVWVAVAGQIVCLICGVDHVLFVRLVQKQCGQGLPLTIVGRVRVYRLQTRRFIGDKNARRTNNTLLMSCTHDTARLRRFHSERFQCDGNIPAVPPSPSVVALVRMDELRSI